MTIAPFSFAGIDPGKTGALAILHPDNSVEFFDVPRVTLRGKDVPAYADWQMIWGTALGLGAVDKAVIEDVAARPGQGVSSMFKFGRTLGFAHAIVLGIRPRPAIEFATPAQWKSKLGLLNSSKGASREKAVNLFPSAESRLTRVKDDGRAEALLLAYYGRKFLQAVQ
jgi:crossover junction endodeoxyribonuclease RuvC